MAFKFTKILTGLISEAAKYDFLSNKFLKPTEKDGKKIKPILTPEEFFTLIQADPDTKMKNVDPTTADEKELSNIKPGGYSEWIIKHYLKPELPPEAREIDPESKEYQLAVKEARRLYLEDIDKITEDLKKYVRFKHKIEGDNNLNKMTPSQLYDKVKDFSLLKTKGTKEDKVTAKETYQYPGSEVIFRGDSWTVVKISDKGPLGKSAAQFFGGYYLGASEGETRWCTSSTMHSHFDYYIKSGPLFVVLPNNWSGKTGVKTGLPATRYQFHFSEPNGPSPQFMDPDDRAISIVEFLRGPMAELKHLFKNEFAKGLVSSGKSLEISDLNQSKVGQFVGLYGLDDLFESLPEDLERIHISNNQAGLLIKIPESIARFKDLYHLGLVNCVSSIPESVCQLKGLNFITLQNNENLKSIPDCLGYLPQIVVISLKNCPNAQIPESFKENGIDRGQNIWDFDIEED